nr:EOG090X0IC1 [Ilyocryptus agilis]
MALIVQPSQQVLDCTEIHSIPCKISHDGFANVSGFFTPYVESKDDTLEASFRGYPLQGKKVIIPAGHTGLILNETKRPLTEMESRNLTISKKFSEFTSWNWDYPPTPNDPIHQALEWLSLSKLVHEE